MSDNTLDSDELSPTQEYIIAGIVILFFGLLYWLLNSDSDFDSHSTTNNIEIPHTNTGSKSIKLTEQQSSATTVPPQNSPITDKPANTTATATSPAEPQKKATAIAVPNQTGEPVGIKASPQVETVEPTNPVTRQSTQEEPASPVTRQNTQAENVEQANALGTPKMPEAPTSPDTPVAPEAPAIPAAPDTAKPDTAETEQLTYSLPDGSEIEIATNGFEDTLKRSILNKQYNQAIVFDKLYFHTGSDKPKAESDHQIKATVALLHNHPEVNILLRGHTDNTGDIKHNAELSLNRANSTGLAISKLGIDSERIRIEGMGDSQPIASNETEEGRKQNRRIELLLIE